VTVGYKDFDIHLVSQDRANVLVGEDPEVASAVVRAIVTASAKQCESTPAECDHRLIGILLARTQLTAKVRVFAPNDTAIALCRKSAGVFWRSIALEVIDRARK
jgi:hypothetical protein